MEACADRDQGHTAALEDFINQHRMPWPEQLALPLHQAA
jgi:hypothetical protein